jgi:hypothetical protein
LISASFSTGKATEVLRYQIGSDARYAELERQPRLAGEARMALFCHLEVIVVKSDGAKTQRDHEDDPDKRILQVCPQHRGDQKT